MKMETTKINHVSYPKLLKKKSLEELRFIIKDCKEAIAAYPDGHKSGYYADEISYAAMEIASRRR